MTEVAPVASRDACQEADGQGLQAFSHAKRPLPVQFSSAVRACAVALDQAWRCIILQAHRDQQVGERAACHSNCIQGHYLAAGMGRCLGLHADTAHCQQLLLVPLCIWLQHDLISIGIVLTVALQRLMRNYTMCSLCTDTLPSVVGPSSSRALKGSRVLHGRPMQSPYKQANLGGRPS
jgi:hypothetical protein